MHEQILTTDRLATYAANVLESLSAPRGIFSGTSIAGDWLRKVEEFRAINEVSGTAFPKFGALVAGLKGTALMPEMYETMFTRAETQGHFANLQGLCTLVEAVQRQIYFQVGSQIRKEFYQGLNAEREQESRELGARIESFRKDSELYKRLSSALSGARVAVKEFYEAHSLSDAEGERTFDPAHPLHNDLVGWITTRSGLTIADVVSLGDQMDEIVARMTSIAERELPVQLSFGEIEELIAQEIQERTGIASDSHADFRVCDVVRDPSIIDRTRNLFSAIVSAYLCDDALGSIVSNDAEQKRSLSALIMLNDALGDLKVEVLGRRALYPRLNVGQPSLPESPL